VRRYLRNPTFKRFDTIPECDRHTHTHTHRDRHTTTVYTASRGKNLNLCVDLLSYDSIALDNRVTITFDLLTLGSVHAGRLSCISVYD